MLESPLSTDAIPAKLEPLTPSKISQMFQLIFGIAFRVDHSKYVVQILNLKQEDQEILMSFVNSLMKGEPQPQDNSSEIKRLLEELERKDFEAKLVRERNDELEQGAYELKERIIVLKDENDKLSDELHQLQAEKTELLIELGLNHYDASYQDIVRRYKEQIRNYQGKLEEMEVFLDSKNSQIEERSSEIELLKQSIGSKIEMEEEKHYKSQEYAKLLDQNNEELDELRRQIEVLNEQLAAKNQRIAELNKDKSKYQEDIKGLKLDLLKTEKPLAKYQQLRKLYKGFISSIRPHIDP